MLNNIEKYSAQLAWYVVGFMRSIPSTQSFVFPVLARSDFPGDYFLAISSDELLVPLLAYDYDLVVPVTAQIVCIGNDIAKCLPLYGFEESEKSTWFGTDLTSQGRKRGWLNSASEVSKSILKRFERDTNVMPKDDKSARVSIQTVVSNNFTQLNNQAATHVRPMTVIGVGGGASAIVEYLIRHGRGSNEYAVICTDKNTLIASNASKKISLNSTGMGAEGRAEKGRWAANAATNKIKALFAGVEFAVLITALGGGTGGGATPVVARIAKKMGVTLFCIATSPFEFEGGRRTNAARAGLNELQAHASAILNIQNDSLFKSVVLDPSMANAFDRINDEVLSVVSVLSELFYSSDQNINIDFEDLRTVLSEPGALVIGSSKARGGNRADLAANDVIHKLFGTGKSILASGVIVHIASGNIEKLRISESKAVINRIRKNISDAAHVIYGSSTNSDLADQIRVTVIAVGVSRSSARKSFIKALNISKQDDLEIPAFLRRQAD